MIEKPIPAQDIPVLNELITPTTILNTPMDKKTIVNALTKRIPEIRKIDLVDKDPTNGRYELVVLAELGVKDECATIIVEDDFNMFMRHRDLMNLCDRIHNEIVDRKKRKKANMLPHDFFTSDKHNSFIPYR